MDVFDDENVISAASSPQENPSPLSLEEQRLRTSSPGLHSTIDPFFHLSGPHPSTSYRFAPSSAPELSPPYLAYSDLPSQSFKDPVAAPDTYWSSSADLASSKAFPGTRSQFDHFLAAEFDPPEGIVDVAGPSPGVLPNLLSQSVPSGSFHSHQQQTKSCDSLPSVHLGEHHHLRRASYPAPTWSSYQLSQDAIPTQINSQNDVLPPLSTLFLGYHRGLSTYNPFDLNTPPTIARQPFELHPVNQDGGDLDSTITHYRGLDDIYSRPEACLNLEPKTDARLPAIPAAGRIPSGPTHHGVTVTYTDDAVSKETQHVRRVCFNCQATEPPSWRRSALNPGKIVCNRCGLYERTHLRARPHRLGELHGGRTSIKSRRTDKAPITGDPSLGRRVLPKKGYQGAERRSSVTSIESSPTIGGSIKHAPTSSPPPFEFPASIQPQSALEPSANPSGGPASSRPDCGSHRNSRVSFCRTRSATSPRSPTV